MKDRKPLVSVLMTVYNRERYLATAIESVLAQSFQDFELIIVDDCSTDNSIQIARQYLSDPRVHHHVNDKNLGDYPNRNRAASYAEGKYLKYVDADDFILPNCLEVMTSAMERFSHAGAGISVGGWQWGMLPQQLMPKEVYRVHFFHSQNIFGAAPLSSIIRRDVFEELGGFREGWNTGDSDFWMRAFSTWPAVCLPPGLAHWRSHEGQESSMQKRDVMKQADVSSRMRKLTISALENETCPLTQHEQSYLIHGLKKTAFRAGASQLTKFRLRAALMLWRIISTKDIPCLVLRRKQPIVHPINSREEKRSLPKKQTIQKVNDAPPLVTVLLPVGQLVTDLEKSICSVTNQTQESWELLVLDQSGRSDVKLVMEKYASDERLRHVQVMRIDNKWGVYNLGADLSQSKYLKFLEPGDCLYEYCLQSMLSLMEHHSSAALGISGPCGPYRPGIALDPSASLDSELFGTPRFLESASALIVDREKFLESGRFEPEFDPPERHLQLKLSRLGAIVLMQQGLVHQGEKSPRSYFGEEQWPLGWAQGYPWIIEWLLSIEHGLEKEQVEFAIGNLLRVAWQRRNRTEDPTREKKQILQLARRHKVTVSELNQKPPFMRKGGSPEIAEMVKRKMLEKPDWNCFGLQNAKHSGERGEQIRQDALTHS